MFHKMLDWWVAMTDFLLMWSRVIVLFVLLWFQDPHGTRPCGFLRFQELIYSSGCLQGWNKRQGDAQIPASPRHIHKTRQIHKQIQSLPFSYLINWLLLFTLALFALKLRLPFELFCHQTDWTEMNNLCMSFVLQVTMQQKTLLHKTMTLTLSCKVYCTSLMRTVDSNDLYNCSECLSAQKMMALAGSPTLRVCLWLGLQQYLRVVSFLK